MTNGDQKSYNGLLTSDRELIRDHSLNIDLL
jgi:hypothetical protein